MNAAETLETPETQGVSTATWLRVDQAFPEIEAQALEQVSQTIGSLAVKSLVEVEEVDEANHVEGQVGSGAQDEEGTITLLDGLRGMRDGDEKLAALVDDCLDTEIGEKFFKVKNHSEVELEVDDKLGFHQHGATTVGITVNTIRNMELNPTMFDLTVYGNLKNSYVENLLRERGMFETHDAVIMATTPVDDETRKEYNYFTDTDSISIQKLSGDGDTFTLETAFFAGKVAPDAERHDMKAIRGVAQNHNLDLSDVDAENMPKIMWLVPKGTTMESIVEEMDDVLGGTFYGLNEGRQDYVQHAAMCLERDFSEVKGKIRSKLQGELDLMQVPEDAVRRLSYWSGKFGVEEAVINPHINSKVFGEAAAPLIDSARYQLAHGNQAAAKIYINEAKKVETSSSCPIALRKGKNGEFSDEFSEFDSENSESNDNSDSEEEVEMTCPFCEEKTVGNPCKRIVCKNCKADSTDSEASNRVKAVEYHRKIQQSAEVESHAREAEMQRIVTLVMSSGGPKGDATNAQDN